MEEGPTLSRSQRGVSRSVLCTNSSLIFRGFAPFIVQGGDYVESSEPITSPDTHLNASAVTSEAGDGVMPSRQPWSKSLSFRTRFSNSGRACQDVGHSEFDFKGAKSIGCMLFVLGK